jgi:hypothetical protein
MMPGWVCHPQYLPNGIVCPKSASGLDAASSTPKLPECVSIRSLLANDGVVHSHSIEQFHSHGMQYLADFTMAGSFFAISKHSYPLWV